MKSNTNWYWQQLETKLSVFIAIHTIFHPCLDVSTIKDVSYIPRILCNKKQARKSVQRHTICISDAYHGYILDEIERRYHIEYKIK